VEQVSRIALAILPRGIAAVNAAVRESPVRVSTCLRRRNAGSLWILCAMFVTSRLVVEDGNILPRHAAFVGPNRSLDEASKTP